MAMRAFEFSCMQVRMTPPDGIHLDDVSLQALPNLFRMNLLKMVAGHNRDGVRTPIRRKGSPNNGLWLGITGTEMMARVYKVSKRYEVRPSGLPQEKLIRQDRYLGLMNQPDLYGDTEPLLDALLMWQSKGYDMTAAYVIIPNGWDAEGRLVSLDRRDVELPDAFGDLGRFVSPDDDTAVISPNGLPILGPKADVEPSDSSLLDEDAEGTLGRADRTEDEE